MKPPAARTVTATPVRRGRHHRLARLAPAALAVTIALAGCSAAENYPQSTAQQLQQTVAGVAGSAKSNDYATALAHLKELEDANDAALKAGRMSVARHDAIALSIETIRTDLTALQTQAEQAQLEQQRQQQEQQHTGDGKGGDKGKKKGD